MAEKIRFGVIGYGLMGSSYTEIISQIRDTELVAVVDPKLEIRNQVEQKYKINTYSNCEELFKEEDLDAVAISCPDEFHASTTVMALEKNIHVHLEKPVAANLKDCNKILKAAKKSKAKINIGYILRVLPQYNHLRNAFMSGDIGELLHAYTRRNVDISEGLRWKGKNDLATYLVCHDADVLMWITKSRVKSVYCIGVSKTLKNFNTYDAVQVLLKFTDGAIGTIECSWAEPLGCRFSIDNRIDLVGTKGAGFVNLQDQGIHFYTDKGLQWVDMIFGPRIQEFQIGALKNEIEMFLESIVNNRAVMCSVEEGIEATKIAIATNISLAEKRIVYLDEIKENHN